MTANTTNSNYYLGEPEELFYWGPSRARPLYMSDYMAAVEQFFVGIAADPTMPSPPKSLVIFWDGKMVWLSNAQKFAQFTEELFKQYAKRNKLSEDMASWRQHTDRLTTLKGHEFSEELLAVWHSTLFAEFSLYGAEAAITKHLQRFDPTTRHKIWASSTVLHQATFLQRIDSELKASGNPAALAQTYPWIEDGYDGVHANAKNYFEKRLRALQSNSSESAIDIKPPEQFDLHDDEASALKLASQLAQFMDDRKAWMMQTRRRLKESLTDVEHGWFFDGGQASTLDKATTAKLWEQYINYRTLHSAVTGMVASSGGKHFITGEVAVVTSPTDSMAEDKIMVVPSTSPSYVPLMIKARALITDHGGIMSHAAIVARELGLPCIVGTSHATKVLKSGDKVTLDLIKGEVSN